MRAKGIFRMGTVRRGGSLLAVLVTASALLLLPLEAVGRADISVRWSRSAGAELASVASGDGAIYVTGSRMKTDGNTAMLLVRYDPSGAVTWTRSWGPRRARTDGTSVAVGPDGSVFVVGNVSAENMEGGGWFIRRYSSNGALLWHRTSSDWRLPEQASRLDSVAVGNDMLVVAGNVYGCCGEVYNDGWVRAFRLDGTSLWKNAFETTRPETDDAARAVAIASGDRVVVAGWIATGPETDVDMADHEVFVQELRPNGSVTWSKVFFDRKGRDRDGATAVAVRGGSLMVAAEAGGWYLRRRPSHAQLTSMKLDGTVVWTRSWGQDPDHAAQPASLSLGPKGSAFVVGTQADPTDEGSDAFVRRFSASGDLLSRLALEGARYVAGTSVAAVRRGAYVAGHVTDEYGEGAEGLVWRLRATD